MGLDAHPPPRAFCAAPAPGFCAASSHPIAGSDTKRNNIFAETTTTGIQPACPVPSDTVRFTPHEVEGSSVYLLLYEPSG